MGGMHGEGGHACQGGVHGKGGGGAVCGEEEGVCMVKGVFVVKGGGGHMWQKGGVCGKGDMHGRGGTCVAGGGMHGRRDGHCSGRYASYWNAFLFRKDFVPVPRSIFISVITCYGMSKGDGCMCCSVHCHICIDSKNVFPVQLDQYTERQEVTKRIVFFPNLYLVSGFFHGQIWEYLRDYMFCWMQFICG